MTCDGIEGPRENPPVGGHTLLTPNASAFMPDGSIVLAGEAWPGSGSVVHAFVARLEGVPPTPQHLIGAPKVNLVTRGPGTDIARAVRPAHRQSGVDRVPLVLATDRHGRTAGKVALRMRECWRCCTRGPAGRRI